MFDQSLDYYLRDTVDELAKYSVPFPEDEFPKFFHEESDMHYEIMRAYHPDGETDEDAGDLDDIDGWIVLGRFETWDYSDCWYLRNGNRFIRYAFRGNTAMGEAWDLPPLLAEYTAKRIPLLCEFQKQWFDLHLKYWEANREVRDEIFGKKPPRNPPF